jgi:hypothetical protein
LAPFDYAHGAEGSGVNLSQILSKLILGSS